MIEETASEAGMRRDAREELTISPLPQLTVARTNEMTASSKSLSSSLYAEVLCVDLSSDEDNATPDPPDR